MEFLKNKSVQQLMKISKAAKKLADDLQKDSPSYALALANGVSDISYNTTANGYINSYTGEAIVVMENGSKWKCIGRGPKGDAWSVSRNGYIEFIPINE